MSDTEMITIRAEMLSDIPVKAAESAAAIKAMADETKTGATSAGSAVEKLPAAA